MWGQSDKFMKTCIHRIRTARIQAPGRPPVLKLHHPPTHEYSAHPTKKNFLKKLTQFYFLPLVLIYNIYIWNTGLLHRNHIKPVLVRITQHYPVLRASTAYDLKYVPFDYYTHYDHIKYVWADRR